MSRQLAGVLACLVLLAGCSGLESTGDKGFITAEGAVSEVALD